MKSKIIRPCALALLIASTTSQSIAQDMQQLQEQVASLQAQEAASSEEQSFEIEQAEFEKMRMQLIQKEREILNATTETEILNKPDLAPISPPSQDLAHTTAGKIDQTEQQVFSSQNGDSTTKLKRKLSENNQEIAALRAELQDLRNKLLIAESEIERLSKTSSLSPIDSRTNSNRLNDDANPSTIFSTAKERANNNSSDDSSTIITVVAESGALRTAPNSTSSIIMEVDSGARLAVDDRRGDWFRISTSSGMRAWISAAEVAFGPTNSASPSNTIRIRPSAQDQQAEEERAFELLKNR
jgi:molecular chaperone GrpE (heat shock protein)